MLRWFLRRKLDTEEKKLGESMDYLRHIVDVSPGAFLRFASIMPFANCRRLLPKEAWFSAQIITLQHEDCGPCLQIAVNVARQQGVSTDLIQVVLDRRYGDLPDEIADVCAFAKSVVEGGDEETLRDKIRTRYGNGALIELSFAIASARIPPTVKRVLGYAKSCRVVEIHTSSNESANKAVNSSGGSGVF
jgi:hypothetical protein